MTAPLTTSPCLAGAEQDAPTETTETTETTMTKTKRPLQHRSRTTALYFTLTTLLATSEATITALYMPYPKFTLVVTAAAAFLAYLTATEWTALRTHGRTHRS